MKHLKKYWYIPFAVLAVVALIAASPAPRRLLSETFTGWIKIVANSPIVYYETYNESGGFWGGGYFLNEDDSVGFSAGAGGENGDFISYNIRVGPYNGPLGIHVDADGDVGIKTVPATGVELDVGGDAEADSLTINHATVPEAEFDIANEEMGSITVRKTGAEDQSYIEISVRSHPGRQPPAPSDSGSSIEAAAAAGSMGMVGVIVGPDTPSLDGNLRGDGAVDFGTFRNDAADVASGDYATISGGRTNRASGLYSTVSGGSTNDALGMESSVGGGFYNIADGTGSVIAGGAGNAVEDMYGVIGGGYENSIDDSPYDDPAYSVIGGGEHNVIGTDHSVIGGGELNVIAAGFNGGTGNVIGGGFGNNIVYDGGQAPDHNVIGGGKYNMIYNGTIRVTIGGGYNNTAYGIGTIAGGSINQIGLNGQHGAIPGGAYNEVSANYGTAMGYNARASMYGEVAMGSGDPNSGHSLLQVRRTVTLDNTWRELSLTGGGQHLMIHQGEVFYIHVMVIITTEYGDEVGIYEVQAVAKQDGMYTGTLVWSSVITHYEDDASWDVRAHVNDVGSPSPDELKIQMKDADEGGDAVNAIGTIRLSRIIGD